jgi:hypothetical protein
MLIISRCSPWLQNLLQNLLCPLINFNIFEREFISFLGMQFATCAVGLLVSIIDRNFLKQRKYIYGVVKHVTSCVRTEQNLKSQVGEIK